MDLQQALNRFKLDLETYIQEEVARQVAAKMGAVSSASSSLPSVRTDVSTASVSGNSSDVQSSLDTLAELATPHQRITTTSVDKITADFGGPTATIEAQTQSQETPSNGDYLKQLAEVAQSKRPGASQDAIDKLTAMIGNGTDGARTGLPQVADDQKTGNAMNGIQSFLNKIRERKNLSSN